MRRISSFILSSHSYKLFIECKHIWTFPLYLSHSLALLCTIFFVNKMLNNLIKLKKLNMFCTPCASLKIQECVCHSARTSHDVHVCALILFPLFFYTGVVASSTHETFVCRERESQNCVGKCDKWTRSAFCTCIISDTLFRGIMRKTTRLFLDNRDIH